MLNYIKHSFTTVGTTGLLSLGAFAIASPTYAASIDLSSWTGIGDVTTATNSATINSGTLSTVFIGGGTSDLDTFLGVNATDLDALAPDSFTGATKGSAIKTTLTGINAGDVFSFNWSFVTNDDDKAFVTINNEVIGFTGTSPFNYSFATAGNYNIGIGVVDVDDVIGTSTLTITNAKIQPVPEPMSILGSVAAFGFGLKIRKRFSKSGN